MDGLIAESCFQRGLFDLYLSLDFQLLIQRLEKFVFFETAVKVFFHYGQLLFEFIKVVGGVFWDLNLTFTFEKQVKFVSVVAELHYELILGYLFQLHETEYIDNRLHFQTTILEKR